MIDDKRQSLLQTEIYEVKRNEYVKVIKIIEEKMN